MKKGNIVFGALAILGLICLAVAATLIFNTELLKNVKKGMSPAPSLSPSPSVSPASFDENTNWKTF